MQHKLCVIGEALIDFIPQQVGCPLESVTSFKRVAGGAPANVAGAYARLGFPSMVLTQLGQDAFGDHIIHALSSCGVDVSHIKQTNDFDTSLSFVSLKEDGQRDFKFYRRTAADLNYDPNNITDDILDDCGVVHFCSVSLVESPMKHAHEKLLELAKKKHILISFDPNLRLSLWNDDAALMKTIHQFLPYANIIKIADDELAFITGSSSIEMALPSLLKDQCKIVIYTQGKHGATIFTKDLTLHSDGYIVDAVDTTGAGDSFIAAFLYQCVTLGIDIDDLDQSKLQEALDFANLYAAHTTTIEGALDAMADHAQLKEFKKRL